MNLRIELYQDGIELDAIRATSYYTNLAPYAREVLRRHPAMQPDGLDHSDEQSLSVEERFLFFLQQMLGEIMYNAKSRLFIKEQMASRKTNPSMSAFALETIDRTYLNELYILFERISRVIGMVEKAFRDRVSLEGIKLDVLAFFDPLLFDLRHTIQHRIYIDFPGLRVLKVLEDPAFDAQNFVEYRELYLALIDARLEFYTYTEKELGRLHERFLGGIEERLRSETGKGYRWPEYLAEDFSLSDRIKSDLRNPRRYNHRQIYESNLPDAET